MYTCVSRSAFVTSAISRSLALHRERETPFNLEKNAHKKSPLNIKYILIFYELIFKTYTIQYKVYFHMDTYKYVLFSSHIVGLI